MAGRTGTGSERCVLRRPGHRTEGMAGASAFEAACDRLSNSAARFRHPRSGPRRGAPQSRCEGAPPARSASRPVAIGGTRPRGNAAGVGRRAARRVTTSAEMRPGWAASRRLARPSERSVRSSGPRVRLERVFRGSGSDRSDWRPGSVSANSSRRPDNNRASASNGRRCDRDHRPARGPPVSGAPPERVSATAPRVSRSPARGSRCLARRLGRHQTPFAGRPCGIAVHGWPAAGPGSSRRRPRTTVRGGAPARSGTGRQRTGRSRSPQGVAPVCGTSATR